jgi:hypothetical protein
VAAVHSRRKSCATAALISNRLLCPRVSTEMARLYLVELAAARTRLAEAQRQSK